MKCAPWCLTWKCDGWCTCGVVDGEPLERKTGTEVTTPDAAIIPEPYFYKDMEMVYKPRQQRLERCLEHAMAFLEFVVPHMGEPDTPNQKLADEIVKEAQTLLAARTAGNYEGRSNGPEGLNSQGMSGETMPDGA